MTQNYYEIRGAIENIKNKSDIQDVMRLIQEAENKEYRGYYEDECQYTEKELLLFSKYDYNNAIGLISSDDEKFMNVYCKNYDYINDENVGENYDYINDDTDENVVEITSNVKPTSSLFDQPKPRPQSLLIYYD